mmetsp:Transcript_27802/g.63675  ORF Transcript_27802/g.63675 Transcript_27802/m.63675 type:complete len:84 (-) Transcript_27802:402-653(-)
MIHCILHIFGILNNGHLSNINTRVVGIANGWFTNIRENPGLGNQQKKMQIPLKNGLAGLKDVRVTNSWVANCGNVPPTALFDG